MHNEASVALALGATALAVVVWSARAKKSIAPFPPGPKGTFLLGNALDLPLSKPWITFTEWAKTYGPIVHLSVFGKHIIVLNDLKYAIDILDKKSRIYSNRPTLVMGGELVGYHQILGFFQLGKQWAEQRRIIAQFIGTRSKVETSYGASLETAVYSFMQDLLENPNMWRHLAFKFAGTAVLNVTCGYQPKDENDSFLQLADESMRHFSELTGANAFAVDTFPFLRYVPEWFPGAGWKKKIGPYRATRQAAIDAPFNWVKRQVELGRSMPGMVSDLLSSHKYTAEEEHTVKLVGFSVMGGKCILHCLTAAVIETFFLAMVLHPDAQRKAQIELDSDLGPGTVPRSTDRSRLPFVEALILEVFRKYTIGPLGFPHAAAEDDVHNGYFIPKDTIILANTWLFFRDPKIYSDPEAFRPERFIETPTHAKEMDPREIVFGYGRRVCPGSHLANMTAWLVCAAILTFFDISAPIEDGRPVIPSGEFLDGTISRPAEFKCVVTARKGAAEAIRRLVDV
ncbi:cytochrome P450 [Roridomyces roridus]|uniref:Cytochrome P450 n=1 Tax=Roridomyces roridus TaxID=1738132 RepID=A0AAD7FRP0_9AGAR|nr:cytochrome P450 [Roridomyces roridus]